MKMILKLNIVCLTFLLFSCSVKQVSMEKKYYLDFDDFNLVGINPTSSPEGFPYIELTENLQDKKVYKFHISESYTKTVAFIKHQSGWLTQREFKEGEFLLEEKSLIFSDRKITVVFDKENGWIHYIIKRLKGSNTKTYYLFNDTEKKFTEISNCESVIKDSDSVLSFEYIRRTGEIKVNEFKEGKTVDEYCYKGKPYNSLYLFQIDNKEFCN